MKQPFVSGILGFTLVLFSSCMGQDNLISLQEFVAVTNSKPVSHSRRVTDSVQVIKSKAVVPAKYQHIWGMNYQKWRFPALQIGAYIRLIFEDKKGNLWFGTNGEGVGRFDGKQLIYLATYNGLSGSQVTAIMEDNRGNIWCATDGGISRFNTGMKNDNWQVKSFTNFNEKTGIGNNEVWNIYEDKKGNIWFSSEGFGVYRYDGKTLTNFGEKEGLGVKAVQTIYEDSKGRLWIGGGGLYRFDEKDTFFNVTRDGLTDGC
jgi:ligand-binding sensor domain-containing protein